MTSPGVPIGGRKTVGQIDATNPLNFPAEQNGLAVAAALLSTRMVGAPIGGVKVMAKSGWFVARPSGTEDIYKIYAESFRGAEHLRRILEEAQTIVGDALAASPPQPGIASKPILKEKR